jgi:acetoin utilization deacetylase AcuC-like enzyme
MDAFYTHQFVLPLPPGHRFPMEKYARLYERVAVHAEALAIRLLEPAPASDQELGRAHCADYVARVSRGELSDSELRRIGFPWSAAMVERSRRSSGATRDALLAAIRDRSIAVNLAGGTHHAHHDRGGGYCVFNDAVVAARHAQAQGRARRVLVIDLDVHHGDGTAAICAGDPSIYTFSMHAARNYPSVKPDSDLDVALADCCGDDEYLDLLRMHLPLAIARSQADAAIYLAGADPYVGDRLGHLALSKAGLAERDRMVLSQCASAGLPLAIVMAGGYAEEVEDIVDIHFATVAAAARAAAGWR